MFSAKARVVLTSNYTATMKHIRFNAKLGQLAFQVLLYSYRHIYMCIYVFFFSFSNTRVFALRLNPLRIFSLQDWQI